MQDQRIYELIARRLSGEATQAEQQELIAHLQQHPGDQYLYEMLASYWLQHPDLLHEEIEDEEERFQRLLRSSGPASAGEPAGPSLADLPDTTGDKTGSSPVRYLSGRKWWYVAAAAILLISTGIIWTLNSSTPSDPIAAKNAQTPNEVIARPGSRSRLVLPDGTQVWLNAESRLTYLPDFNHSRREVQLEGEAFFDVIEDARRPFIVHTSGIDIRVLGTAFNVKSYAADATIEATLLRGSIEVVKKGDHSAPRVILRPHEKLVFSKSQSIPAIINEEGDLLPSTPERLPAAGIAVTSLPGNQPDSTMKETSWVYNRLVFDGDSFEELAAKMERWYNVKINIGSDKLKQLRLKGAFEKENIREALDALQFTAPFEYTIKGNEIGIFSR